MESLPLSDNVGVLIHDPKGKLLREIREAQRERRLLILRKKQPFDLKAALKKLDR